MIHLEVLVEEASAEPLVRRFVGERLPQGSSYQVHVFDGKPDLLGSLDERLRGYRHWGPDVRILVLVDRDHNDCQILKRRLESAAQRAGLVTKSAASGGRFQVCNRIVVEAVEAWIIGDEQALRAAFSGVATYMGKARFKDPDAISGGTWEALERLLQRAGHYPGGLLKRDCVTRIAPLLEPARNRSRSFQVFLEGLDALMDEEAA